MDAISPIPIADALADISKASKASEPLKPADVIKNKPSANSFAEIPT